MGANELISEVIAYNADAEDSHYDGCYQRHAGCLAVMLRDMLRDPAAPDAATEQAFKKAEAFDKAVALSERRQTLLEEAEAERDAALAAIERVRGVIATWKSVQASNRDQFESGNPGLIVPIDCVGGLSAALDGAPELEWEWGYRGETLIDVHARKSRESAEGAVKDLTEYWALHGKKFEVVRRRKAGPWEPVEGEKP